MFGESQLNQKRKVFLEYLLVPKLPISLFFTVKLDDESSRTQTTATGTPSQKNKCGQ